MGDEFTDPPDTSIFLPEHRMVDVFSRDRGKNKETIIMNFTTSSPLRIMISTVAFGMGIDCNDIRLIIHFDPPTDAQMYVQEIGRGGRDSLPSYAMLLSTAKLLQQCSDTMVSYTEGSYLLVNLMILLRHTMQCRMFML